MKFDVIISNPLFQSGKGETKKMETTMKNTIMEAITDKIKDYERLNNKKPEWVIMCSKMFARANKEGLVTDKMQIQGLQIAISAQGKELNLIVR